MTQAGEALTEDRLLGGRVRLRQPAEGYRAAIDPVLLAAAVPAEAGARVLELGAGAGALFLCLLARCPDARVVAVERDARLARLARENAVANGCEAKVEVVTGGLEAAPQAAFGHVVFNPPFLEAARAQSSGRAARDAANIEGREGLAQWIAAGLAALEPKGRITLIQRADRLGDVLAALAGSAGETVVAPVWPKPGRAAKRVVVTARKGVATPLALAPGLVLHEEEGGFTPEAEALLRDGGHWALMRRP